jgi:hypothetical protein
MVPGTLDSIHHLLAKRRQPADDLLNISMELGSTEAVKEALMAGFGFSYPVAHLDPP